MNLVGKIFVFLIFCMSAVFGSFAVVLYATHVTWREKAIALSAQIDTEKKRNADLVTAKAELNKKLAEEQALHRQHVSTLESEKALLLAENQKTVEMYNTLDTKFKTDLANVGTGQGLLARGTGEVVILRKENGDARKTIDEEFNKTLILNERLQLALGESRRLQLRNEQLVADLSKYKVAVGRIGFNVDNPPSPDTPRVKGHVTGVLRSAQEIYVQLSIGSDDGLQIGNSLEVYRGNTYVGQISVVRVTPNKSVARIVGTIKADVVPGDRVESRTSLKLTAG